MSNSSSCRTRLRVPCVAEYVCVCVRKLTRASMKLNEINWLWYHRIFAIVFFLYVFLSLIGLARSLVSHKLGLDQQTANANWIMWILLNNFGKPIATSSMILKQQNCTSHTQSQWLKVLHWLRLVDWPAQWTIESKLSKKFFLPKMMHYSAHRCRLFQIMGKNVSKCEIIVRWTPQKCLLWNNMMRVVQPHSGPLCIVCTHTYANKHYMTIATCPRRSHPEKERKKNRHTGAGKRATFPWIMVCVYFNVINNEKFNICRI